MAEFIVKTNTSKTDKENNTFGEDTTANQGSKKTNSHKTDRTTRTQQTPND